ncbi:Hsp70 family protein [Propionibacteriaceae bacterium Y2011]
MSSRRTKVLVYDLGGGTFDASLITVDDAAHHVIASRGRHDLGGDDVDRAIADLVLAELDAEASGVDAALLEQCRLAKEMITPQTRRITVEHDDTPVTVPIHRVRDAVAPLVEQTLETMAPLVDGTADSLDDLAGIYLVGGGSGLPLVPRLLRERFGRRVHRSPHPAASTAIGLAIAADPGSGYSLTDRTGREVGIFREGAAGDRIVFEPLLHPDTVPGGAPVVHRYRAAHDIGWFRYAERAGGVAPGRDTELIPIGEVRMPFRPELQHLDETELAGLPVTRTHAGPRVEESCTVGEDGLVTVTITDLDSGHTRTVELRGGSPVS